MTKRQEKFPEVAAFEQAFARPAQGNSSSFSRSQTRQVPFASQPLGRVPRSNPKLSSPGLPSASWSPSPGRSTGSRRAQGWGPNNRGYEEDEEEEWQPWSGHKQSAPPPTASDRFVAALARLALIIVALIAAYSLQSHSRRHYIPGTINGATVSNVSYDAGWPLTYAHVQAQQAPLSDVDPTPAFHYISPALLAADVLLVAVPFWLLLESVWLLWIFVLERFGPRRLLRRLFAVGFTALPATLWVLGSLGAGIFLGFNGGELSTLPIYLLPVLAPAIPGFGLAASISILLEIPPALWRADFGVFLLTLALPLALLTILLYMLFCALGRALGGMFRGNEE